MCILCFSLASWLCSLISSQWSLDFFGDLREGDSLLSIPLSCVVCQWAHQNCHSEGAPEHEPVRHLKCHCSLTDNLIENAAVKTVLICYEVRMVVITFVLTLTFPFPCCYFMLFIYLFFILLHFLHHSNSREMLSQHGNFFFVCWIYFSHFYCPGLILISAHSSFAICAHIDVIFILLSFTEILSTIHPTPSLPQTVPVTFTGCYIPAGMTNNFSAHFKVEISSVMTILYEMYPLPQYCIHVSFTIARMLNENVFVSMSTSIHQEVSFILFYPKATCILAYRFIGALIEVQ